MCLNILDKKVEFDCNGKATVFKTLFVTSSTIQSTCQSYIWDQGRNCSDRDSMLLSSSERQISRVDNGFHVYLREYDAICELDDDSNDYTRGKFELVVPMTAYRHHLIATGLNNGSCDGAVFSELYIEEDVYRRLSEIQKDLEKHAPEWEEDEDDEWDDDMDGDMFFDDDDDDECYNCGESRCDGECVFDDEEEDDDEF